MKRIALPLMAGLIGVTFATPWTAEARLSPRDTAQNPVNALQIPIFADKATADYARGIEDAISVCRSSPGEYRVDCFARQLKPVIRKFTKKTDYAPVNKALKQLAAELDQIVKENADAAAAKQRFAGKKTNGKTAKTPKLTAIRADRLAAANRAAEAAIKRAQSAMLRSTPSTDPRAIHFQRVAQSLDGARVLMRS